jgi:outer membrane receptor protein involved in Fe transport
MTYVSFRASRRTSWLCSVALSPFFWPVDTRAQGALVTRPSYTVVNAGVQRRLALRIYNLFDTIYATGGPTTQWLLGMPRTAELSLNVKF